MRYPSVMGEWSTLVEARGGRSISRFGDGEIKLALGRSAKSQAGDPKLALELKKILRAPTGPVLPCIPNIGGPPGPKEAFWSQYRQGRYVSLYASHGVYGSSFVTRPDSAPGIDVPDYWAAVREIWHGRDPILVRGSTKSLVAGELEGAASVHEIVGPRQHAWTERFNIYHEVLALTRAPEARKRPIILCLGATATVLASWLAIDGRWALDLGHIGMFLRKVKRNEPREVTEEDRR